MPLLTSTSSFLRYKIENESQELSLNDIRTALKNNGFPEIHDSDMTESISGWTTLENPYDPDFDSDHISYGTNIVFSLRIDKKSIPQKIIQKEMIIQTKKILKESGRDYLSKNEKSKLKEEIILKLSLIIPSTPNIYDVLWIPEKKEILFFTTQKSINELFETLFRHTFSLPIIRLFPYTKVYFNEDFNNGEKENFYNTKPLNIPE